MYLSIEVKIPAVGLSPRFVPQALHYVVSQHVLSSISEVFFVFALGQSLRFRNFTSIVTCHLEGLCSQRSKVICPSWWCVWP